MSELILDLQSAMMAAITAGAVEPAALEFENMIADGVLARIMKAPKGSVVIGKEHAGKHICVFLYGSMIVEGEIEVHAPAIFVSEPGKKVARFTSDSAFINFHRIEHDEELKPFEEMMSSIENRVIVPEQQVLEFTEKRKEIGHEM